MTVGLSVGSSSTVKDSGITRSYTRKETKILSRLFYISKAPIIFISGKTVLERTLYSKRGGRVEKTLPLSLLQDDETNDRHYYSLFCQRDGRTGTSFRRHLYVFLWESSLMSTSQNYTKSEI